MSEQYELKELTPSSDVEPLAIVCLSIVELEASDVWPYNENAEAPRFFNVQTPACSDQYSSAPEFCPVFQPGTSVATIPSWRCGHCYSVVSAIPIPALGQTYLIFLRRQSFAHTSHPI